MKNSYMTWENFQNSGYLEYYGTERKVKLPSDKIRSKARYASHIMALKEPTQQLCHVILNNLEDFDIKPDKDGLSLINVVHKKLNLSFRVRFYSEITRQFAIFDWSFPLTHILNAQLSYEILDLDWMNASEKREVRHCLELVALKHKDVLEKEREDRLNYERQAVKIDLQNYYGEIK